jgi:hypothetical protein
MCCMLRVILPKTCYSLSKQWYMPLFCFRLFVCFIQLCVKLTMYIWITVCFILFSDQAEEHVVPHGSDKLPGLVA